MDRDELLARMRGRVSRVREIAEMAHDPKMVEMLLQMADEGEADIRKLEAEPASPSIEIEPFRQS